MLKEYHDPVSERLRRYHQRSAHPLSPWHIRIFVRFCSLFHFSLFQRSVHLFIMACIWFLFFLFFCMWSFVLSCVIWLRRSQCVKTSTALRCQKSSFRGRTEDTHSTKTSKNHPQIRPRAVPGPPGRVGIGYRVSVNQSTCPSVNQSVSLVRPELIRRTFFHGLFEIVCSGSICWWFLGGLLMDVGTIFSYFFS